MFRDSFMPLGDCLDLSRSDSIVLYGLLFFIGLWVVTHIIGEIYGN